MIIFFWFSTLLFTVFALIFVLPWLSSRRLQVAVIILITLTAYGLYDKLGYGSSLAHYYSPEQQRKRVNQAEFRELLTEFRKQEFRLRLRLEENPSDSDAEWRLLDILGIKALQNGNIVEAKEYWAKALKKMPTEYQTQFKARIANLPNP